MPFFLPNDTALHYAKTGQSMYGEITFALPVSVGVIVVEFLDTAKDSPMRSEASASHGRVQEDSATARILFPATWAGKQGDRVDIFGVSLVVTGIYPRKSLLGQLEHKSVSLALLDGAT